MKKKHIIIIILAVLVLAGLFTIYKLPVKDSEAIDLDSDVTIIINSTGLNYIDGKAYPKIDTKMYSVKKDSEQHKKIKEIIGNTKLYRKKESSVNRISPGGASVYIKEQVGLVRVITIYTPPCQSIYRHIVQRYKYDNVERYFA